MAINQVEERLRVAYLGPPGSFSHQVRNAGGFSVCHDLVVNVTLCVVPPQCAPLLNSLLYSFIGILGEP
jgi:hypothetical protein